MYTRIKMTQFAVPQAETFNLLGDKKSPDASKIKNNKIKTVSHLRTRITFTLVTDTPELPVKNIPAELVPNIRYIF